jgi:GT2 family glycosyltransferase
VVDAGMGVDVSGKRGKRNLINAQDKCPVLPITIAIPTYQRGGILLETLGHLLRQNPPASEILVVDQTDEYDRDINEQLNKLHDGGLIRWLKMDKPSIPKAMNHALLHATFPVVLFLDDDIIPNGGLIAAHAANYDDANIWGVAGQVLQPGQAVLNLVSYTQRADTERDMEFPFNSTARRFIAACMAGNFSVRRDNALQIGGFDENFIGDAYRFETEFCRRLLRHGGSIMFEPLASIRHLRAPSGGTRSYGNHMKSASPEVAAGEYYFALLETQGLKRFRYIAHRMARSVRTRFHLVHPWWIPVKLLGEIRGLFLALRLKKRGPMYIRSDAD